MGVKCDICEAQEGSVFCFAENAVMCEQCDVSKHTSSKQAAKHERVALSKAAESTQCDICQDRPAVLFCADDRALICRRCDLMIHNANEFTAKHKRFLLSGFALGMRALGTPGAGPSSDPNLADPARLTGGAGPRSPLLSSGGLSNGAGSSMSDPQLLHTHSGSGGGRMSNGGLPGGSPGWGGGSAWAGANAARYNNGKAQMTATMKAQAEEAQRELLEAQREAAAHPFASLADMWNQPSSSGSGGGGGFTLAHELLGLPAISQGFTAKDIDAAYMFEDIGDLDDDLSSLLVPDLDLGGAAPAPLEPPAKAAALAGPSLAVAGPSGTYTRSARHALSPSQDGVVPDLSAPVQTLAKRRRAA
ncbi:hypothetical protein WJX81_008514 [Elliptochloris bilobata]|uniref:B box-type domain-containing protein n=1 Tax=Elliptochloris bilobata TaxID=381761 RepID=A0AAW1RRT2_9CHLO